MAQLAQWFMEGGVFMWVILILDVFLLGLAVVSLAVAIAGSGPVALQIAAVVGSALPAAAGAAGTWHGRQQVEAALAAAAPEFRDELARMGGEQAALALQFGGASSVVLVVLSGAALAYALSARASQPARDPRTR